MILLRRGVSILRDEGAKEFLKKTAQFVKATFRITYHTCYVYEKSLDDVQQTDETEFLPRISDYTLIVISTPEQIDDVVASGLDIKSYRSTEELKRLVSLGAILFCVFVGKELAHRVWVSLTLETRHIADPFPFAMDYEHEGCFAGSHTNPKYRGAGFYTYATAKMYQYLKAIGRTKVRFTILKKDRVPQQVQARFAPRLYAEGFYLRFLGWSLWRERPYGG